MVKMTLKDDFFLQINLEEVLPLDLNIALLTLEDKMDR